MNDEGSLGTVIRPAAAAHTAMASPLEDAARAKLHLIRWADVGNAQRVRTHLRHAGESPIGALDGDAQRRGSKLDIGAVRPRHVSAEIVERLAVVFVQSASAARSAREERPLNSIIAAAGEAHHAAVRHLGRPARHDGASARVDGHVEQVERAGGGRWTSENPPRVYLGPCAGWHPHVHSRKTTRRVRRRCAARVGARGGRRDRRHHEIWAEKILPATGLLAEHCIHAGRIGGTLLRKRVVQRPCNADACLVSGSELRVDVRQQSGARAQRGGISFVKSHWHVPRPDGGALIRRCGP
mmetsp:Transcript_78045/g.155119  ORF Transcript_78045/g.155119 Transcript_78045/m.155119 type:complete len:297 (+) Transcript_78045:840-1730(+)